MGTGSVTARIVQSFSVFGRRMPCTVEKGDRHLAATVSAAFGADVFSEPVPFFDSPFAV